MFSRLFLGLAFVCLVGGGFWLSTQHIKKRSQNVELKTQVAPHSSDLPLKAYKATFRLELDDDQPQSKVTSASGELRLVFDGRVCDGFSTQLFQTTRMVGADGDVVEAAYKAITHEDIAAQRFDFDTELRVNNETRKQASGYAVVKGQDTQVVLTRTNKGDYTHPSAALFPALFSMAQIRAAMRGQQFFETDLFDGSGDAQQPVQTLSVIGTNVRPLEPLIADVSSKDRWRFTVSFFEKSGQDEQADQIVSYDMDRYGLTQNLWVDYGSFALKGRMTSFELLPQKPCH